ncbi:OHCU decarboxylase [Alkalilimnicola ehrlichii]|uniref:2-oxo-4-hydroxy-4-carboxy-5-ureidoimidazoline decarboxylase n=1 Tax=Alkalilimnicola ehrlichii TaxID=351052 RepID=A0A3E0X1W8_9GAMM|nr:2-oxo-4-hydroxy-4-carboxy-5-ureidoimidazoline decarboxylase [Alkalilimnicola ehrlichii]RFA24472.1 OHCU decarboxylase [Alkalilimnicola ehrlichii]RFA38490.1 OHCU decarboxylase [Alkalilimnicola ehrlichii]
MAKHLLTPRPSRMNELEFVCVYGGVYEHSPWVAQDAYRAGLTAAADTAEGLAERMAEVFRSASPVRRREVLQAHPDLAGRAAVAGELTEDSSSEQAGAGLDQCTPEEFERFRQLNAAYKARFGFPFIMAVRGAHRSDILQAFAQRLGNDPEVELATAVEQVNRIALLRLRARAAGA